MEERLLAIQEPEQVTNFTQGVSSPVEMRIVPASPTVNVKRSGIKFLQAQACALSKSSSVLRLSNGGFMFLRKVLFVFFVLVCAASTVRAQREYEATGFIGERFGGNIDLTQVGIQNIDYLYINSSKNYGAMFDVSFWGNFQGEFMWNRQPTTLSAHDPITNTSSFFSNLNLDMYQFDILYQFKSSDSKFRPFVVGGLGFSHWGISGTPGINSQNTLGFSKSFSYNIGGGVKYFFNDHWGVRGEVRWSPSHTTQGAGYCSYYGCVPTTNSAEQGQANIGVIFRFNK